MIFLKTDLHWLSGRSFTRLSRANPMRGHWKPGGGFPHLFSCWKQVFPCCVLCPAPRYSIRKGRSWSRNWQQSRATGSVKETWGAGAQPAQLPHASAPHLNPGAPLRPWSSATCSPIKLRCCLQFAPTEGSGRLTLSRSRSRWERAPPPPPPPRSRLCSASCWRPRVSRPVRTQGLPERKQI